MYAASQQKDDPTKFLRLFEFADEAAQETPRGSAAVRRFEGIYGPELVGGPIVFTDYIVIRRTPAVTWSRGQRSTSTTMP